jgi:hypothetical protein
MKKQKSNPSTLLEQKLKLLREENERLLNTLRTERERIRILHLKLGKATERLTFIAAWIAPNHERWDFETRIKYSAASTLNELIHME